MDSISRTWSSSSQKRVSPPGPVYDGVGESWRGQGRRVIGPVVVDNGQVDLDLLEGFR